MYIHLSSFVLIHLRSYHILETKYCKLCTVARSLYAMHFEHVVWMELRQRLIQLYRVLTVLRTSRILVVLTVEMGTDRLSRNVGK